MRDGLLIWKVSGGLQGPSSELLKTNPLDDDTDSSTTSESVGYLFRHKSIVEITDTDSVPNRIEERVYLGHRWLLTVLIASLLILVGTVIQEIDPGKRPVGVSFQMVGIVGLIGCWRLSLLEGRIQSSDLYTPDKQYFILGPFAATAIPGLIGVLTDGVVAVVASSIAVVITAGIAYHPILRERLGTLWTRLHRSVPTIPTLHIIFTIAGAVIVTSFLSSVVSVRVPPLELLGAISLSVVAVGLGISSFETRREARIAVITAAGVTGVAFSSLGVSIMSDGASITGIEDPIPLLISGLGGAALWAIGVSALYTLARSVYQRFDQEGRQPDTRIAALFAYLTICGSGSLLLAGFGFSIVGVEIFSRPTGLLELATIGLYGIPLAFFIVGSLYQLVETVRNIRIYKRHSSARQLDSAKLPIEPTYPVRIIEGDGFFAAAYADTSTEYIALSEEAVELLDANGLAAVVAHEESHLRERGAFLQVIFSILPAMALLGKNVVFGLYDFMTREETADEYAVARLNEVGIDGTVALREALQAVDEAEPADETLIGFLPTATTIPERIVNPTPLQRVFGVFYGHFAGGVHPSTEERLGYISQLSTELTLDELDDDQNATLD